LPTLVGTDAMPYGLMSPLAGTVEATMLTPVNSPRNGPEPGVDSAAGLLAVVVELVLDELVLLPQPATASATPTRKRIDILGTLRLLWLGV
jgi:hypothetical protein